MNLLVEEVDVWATTKRTTAGRRTVKTKTTKNSG